MVCAGMPRCTVQIAALSLLFFCASALLSIELTKSELKNANDSQTRHRDRAMGASKTSIFIPLLAKAKVEEGENTAAETYAKLGAYFEDATKGKGNCGLQNKDKWPESFEFSASLRYWPVADKNCTSTTYVDPGLGIPEIKLKVSPTELLKLANEKRTMLNAIAKAALKKARLPKGWFPKPENVARSYRTGDYTTCSFSFVTAIRYTEPEKSVSDGQWYINSGFSSTTPNMDLPSKQRRYRKLLALSQVP